MPKSLAAWVTDRLAARTAWAKAVLSSDTVLVLHGMTDPRKRSRSSPKSATHVPATTVTHVPAPFTCELLGIWVSGCRKLDADEPDRQFVRWQSEPKYGSSNVGVRPALASADVVSV